MARILDINYYIPPDKITNQFLSKKFPKWTPEKIFIKTGIRERGKAAKNVTAGDLAISAAKKLFENLDITPDCIDMLIFVTQTPNQCLPSTSCEIHSELSLPEKCGAFDINQGCTGYIYGLNMASSLIDSGSAKYVLLLTGDTYSKLLDKNDPSVNPIFGDAASASLIGPDLENSEKSIGKFEFGTDGSKAKFLNCDFGGFRKTKDDWNSLYMNGAEVMTFTLKIIPKAIKQYLDKYEISMQEIDLFVLHQANKFILDRIHIKSEIKEKGVICLEMFGNTVSSSIPIALANKVNFKSKSKIKILIVGFGVGLSWGVGFLKI